MVPPNLYLAQNIILPGPSGTSYHNLSARGGRFKEETHAFPPKKLGFNLMHNLDHRRKGEDLNPWPWPSADGLGIYRINHQRIVVIGFFQIYKPNLHADT
jgi:hypothetical protein